MKEKITRQLHTIRARILLSTISIIVMISAVIMILSYYVVSQNLRQNLIQTSETRLSFLCSSIDSNINNVKIFIRSCQINSKIGSFVMEQNPTDNASKREAHDFVTETYSSNAALPSQLIRLIILSKSRDDIIQIVESPYSSIKVSSEKVLSLPYFETLHENPGEVATGILQDPFITTKNVSMIPFVHSIEHPYKADEIGCIYTEISLSVITGPIQNYLDETDSHFFFRIGDYLYRYTDHSLEPFSDEFAVVRDLSAMALSDGTSVLKVLNPDDGSTSIMISRPLSSNGWYVTEALDESHLTHDIFSAFLLISLIILGAAALLCMLLFSFLSKTVNVPVRTLQARMKRIESGDFERDPSTEWNHELGEIGRTINDLSENVQTLLTQRIADERQKKDYEYRMLQSQINPHFLYNTLNSIKWMATIQNSPGIAEMTTALSRLLKDIAKGTTNLIPLSHELALIRDYFTIQQYRYGGTITMQYEIENPALESIKILKFTMQPIVENAIFHGIEPKGSAGMILVHIYQDESSDVHIDITDNGIGMKPEVAAHLLEQEAPTGSSFFKEIGISNVHKRLQYEFGAKYGLSISSEQGFFTTVSILLPFNSEK